MGKVREQFTNDVHGLAQWVGRKVKNHHPMSHREGTNEAFPLAVKRKSYGVKDGEVSEPGVAYCGIVAGVPNTIRYGLADGRVFEIKIMDVTTHAELSLVKVGS